MGLWWISINWKNPFAKYILEVPLNTSNSAVLGELGLYPVWVSTKLKAVKFWNRIYEENAASVLVEDAIILSCSLASSGKDSWFKESVSSCWRYRSISQRYYFLLGDLPKKLRNLLLTRWELDLSRQGANQEKEATCSVHIIFLWPVGPSL